MRPFVLIWKHGVSEVAINSGIADKHDSGYYGIGGLIGGGHSHSEGKIFEQGETLRRTWLLLE